MLALKKTLEQKLKLPLESRAKRPGVRLLAVALCSQLAGVEKEVVERAKARSLILFSIESASWLEQGASKLPRS